MSPSEQMIRTLHWICSACGEVARTSRPPRDCRTCGHEAAGFEQGREHSFPND